MSNYERLDAAIEARRLDLGLSWKQLAEAAGISDVSLRNFRKGRSEPNALSKRRIEDALQWFPGAVNAVLNGGDPIPLGIRPVPAGGEPTPRDAAPPPELDKDQLREILRRSREVTADLERLLGDQS